MEEETKRGREKVWPVYYYLFFEMKCFGRAIIFIRNRTISLYRFILVFKVGEIRLTIVSSCSKFFGRFKKLVCCLKIFLLGKK